MESCSVPFFALAVGVAVVLVLILVFKANAFIALLAAAIAVSILAPDSYEPVGEADKLFGPEVAELNLVGDVKRVAVALGNATASIGIIIAMAAIIGTCLTKSGGADRIVQAFLGLFGQKRAPYALMSSGFVLSVPVFFDTVFYLLVPLARSLYRLTEKKYGLYLMAIAAGGAITHTLVPPTPGPLAMAANLQINLGTMIMVGALVAMPAAVGGLLFANLLDRWTTIPFREVASPTVPEEIADPDGPAERGLELPSLGLSLLPVLLPVLMIAANTAVESVLKADGGAGIPSFEEVVVTPAAEGSGDNPVTAVRPVAELTTLQSLHRYTNLFGEPSFALFVAALVAMWLYRKMRKPTLVELSATVEASLADAGVIILITAAGGAFGAMLKIAGVGAAIAQLAGGDGGDGTIGMTVLFLAWGVAALMKAAQGSSTTAMITVSGIFAGVILGTAENPLNPVDVLGFHPVYLATSIGAGSLFGSWMSDSGFWIFTKMGGLTEAESLRTWTPLLAALSVISFAATLVLANVMPLAG